MAHPQSSPRGLFSKSRIDFDGDQGLFARNYSTGTATLTANSTGTVSIVAGIRPSSQANAEITGNSTGIVVTAITMGAHTLSADSTGILLGTDYLDTTS